MNMSLRTRRSRRKTAQRPVASVSFSSRPRVRAIVLAVSLALAAGSVAPPVFAADLPTGGAVVSGSANINSAGANMQIDTQGPRTAINWQSFDIGAGNSVAIAQPDAASTTLNRVIGPNNPSQIFGSLTSNGRVVLLNPSGIWFAPGSHISTSSLLAGAGRISDRQAEEFASTGKLDVTLLGNVRNNGVISVQENGTAALLGAQVENHGIIQARNGLAVLATGPEATLDFVGDGLISIAAGNGGNNPADIAGDVSGGVHNTGMIDVGGGVVAMSATRAASHLDSVVSVGGKVIADSVTSHGGVITLGNAEQTTVSGTLSANGTEGGTIRVLGENVALTDTAKLSAEGQSGSGGQIRVGGSFQGLGPEPGSLTTRVDHGAQLRADGAHAGGTVVVWSNGHTVFAGQASAVGGTYGGIVETSGKVLAVTNGARVDTSGGAASGTWLLDPQTIRIVADNVDPGFDLSVFTDPAELAKLADSLDVSASAIVAALKTGDVLILANEQITVDAAIIAPDVGNNGTRPNTLALVATGDVGKYDETMAYKDTGDAYADAKRNASGQVVIRAPILLKDGNLYISATGDVLLVDNAAAHPEADPNMNRAIVDVGKGTIWIDTTMSGSVIQDANTALIGENVAVRGASVLLNSPLNYAGMLAGEALNGVFQYAQSNASGTVNVGTVHAPYGSGESMQGVRARQLAYSGYYDFSAAGNTSNGNYYRFTLDNQGNLFDVMVFEALPYQDINGNTVSGYEDQDSSDYVVTDLKFTDVNHNSWAVTPDSSSPNYAKSAPDGFEIDAYNGTPVVTKKPIGWDANNQIVYSNEDDGWGVSAFGTPGAANAGEIQHDAVNDVSQQLVVSLGTKTDTVDVGIGYLYNEAAWVSGSTGPLYEAGRVHLFNSEQAENGVQLNAYTATLDYKIDDVTRVVGEPNPDFAYAQQPAAGNSLTVQEVDRFVDQQLGQDRFETKVSYDPAPGPDAPAGTYENQITGTLETGEFQSNRYVNELLPGTLTITDVMAPEPEPHVGPLVPPTDVVLTPEPAPTPEPVPEPPSVHEHEPVPDLPPVHELEPAPEVIEHEIEALMQGADVPGSPEVARPDTELCEALESPSSALATHTATPAVARTRYAQLVCKPRSYEPLSVTNDGTASPAEWANQLVGGQQYLTSDGYRTVIPREVRPETVGKRSQEAWIPAAPADTSPGGDAG
ncbi:filamentous hemagglutinin N-terminal domain-containing protein [Paraburkholderia sp. MMS20-SJTN17]|uniref:Filamentous hemagglutinin N-terminal domain-containing protein n=1 Tax=Paraburkholderia translucens TaxID=2886945 RepID=A0ABS8KLK5_9BURK|nr:filamentous hemagglutinin N-terminal domain-containing protein [Paraburkholderia sp. MMS20-SJTN17]MCC8405284.1 filamentous hemagglutinin N-terminal domain-containing protein [Paraburkholderia sp. MMS20-SJTN17]